MLFFASSCIWIVLPKLLDCRSSLLRYNLVVLSPVWLSYFISYHKLTQSNWFTPGRYIFYLWRKVISLHWCLIPDDVIFFTPSSTKSIFANCGGQRKFTPYVIIWIQEPITIDLPSSGEGGGVTCICRNTGMCHYFGYFLWGAPGSLGIFLGCSRIFEYHLFSEIYLFRNHPYFGYWFGYY